MNSGILLMPPNNTVHNYIPRADAATNYNLPTHMVEYWIAKRRIRIAEFKKDGEGKRSIYVNKEDISMLKDLYEISVEMLSEENDDIGYSKALEDFPQLNKGRLDYLISNCLVDCYIPDSLDWSDAVIRRSDLIKASDQLVAIQSAYERIKHHGEIYFRKDINGTLSKMVYLYCFFKEMREFNFHPVDSLNLRFITVRVNESSRLQYREGFNIIELLTSGKLNGLLEGVHEKCKN